MGNFARELVKRLRNKNYVPKEKADAFEGETTRVEDAKLVAWECTNRSGCAIILRSHLEAQTPLREAPAWREVRIESEGKLLVPHFYFDVFSEDGRDAVYIATPAPRGSDFLYRFRDEKTTGSTSDVPADPDSQPSVSGSQS